MQKKGGTKALFGRPNRSNRFFAFFVRIDKNFFVFCFAVFIVLCALPILRLSSVFLLCRFSFFSAKSIALFVAGRFLCCIAVAFHHLILSFRPGRHHPLPVSLLCFCRIGRVLPAFFIHCLFGLFHRCENSRKKQKRSGPKTSSNPFRFLI